MIVIDNDFVFKWISTCGRYTVFLSQDCFKKIISIGEKCLPNEIGSSLIGYYSLDGYEAFIKEISPIPSDSVSSRFSFLRGTKGLKKYYKELVKRNSNKIYLGEWHTHPFGPSSPSGLDDINQFAISNDKKTNCTESILLILGGDIKYNPELGCMVYSKKRGKIILNSDFI